MFSVMQTRLLNGSLRRLMASKTTQAVLLSFALSNPLNAAEAKSIAVLGTGYVGLVMGAGLASWGHKVICADILEEKIASLQNGKVPFYEPGLDQSVVSNMQAGRLSFTVNVVEAIQKAEIIFVAVPTPSNEDGSADISALEDVAKTIAAHLNGHKIVCIKSTVPIGTTRKIQEFMERHSAGRFACDFIFNPEFLREGSALIDFTQTDRLVLGGENEEAIKKVSAIYSELIASGTPVIETNFESAEAIKYASNAFLATKISFINEFANLCSATSADISTVAYGMGLDKRIGPAFLSPGPGYGGSCFPKDTQGLLHQAAEFNVELKVVQATVEANESQKLQVVQKLKTLLSGDLANKQIAVLGLAFKANTDDVRCSPAISIIGQLLAECAKVSAYDPMGTQNMKKILPNVKYCSSAFEAALEAEALLVLTDWQEFKDLDLCALKGLMKKPVLIDARNLYSPDELANNGFIFSNTGRLLR